MKTLILWMLVLAIASVSNAQNVNIPDAYFRNALIEAGVDTNNDGEISYAEAETITNLNVRERNISDLTGIEAFINLDSLECSNNQLTSLDISKNTNLIFLYCGLNQLTSLDISKNTAIQELWCGDNPITNLDVSKNTALEWLYCNNSQLTSLDVSKNTALKCLYCHENQMTSLNVSDNTVLEFLFCNDNQLVNLNVSGCPALMNLYCGSNQLSTLDISSCYTDFHTDLFKLKGGPIELDISDMPSLYEVCVWVLPFPPDGFYMDTTGSPNVNFTTECSATALNIYQENSTINIYPNPSDDIINIEIENIKNATLEIYNLGGKLIFIKELHSKLEKIDVSDFPSGIYIVKIMQDMAVNVRKVVLR